MKVMQLHSSNGCEHLASITHDGELYTNGYNARGQLGHGVTSHVPNPQMVDALFGKHIVKVACSYYHTVAVSDDDEVFSFGRNDYGQLGQGDNEDKHIPCLIRALPLPAHAGAYSRASTSIRAVACGQYHTVISFTTGGLVAMGKNDYGQLGVESTEARKKPVQVRVGGHTACFCTRISECCLL
jgi:RCC1 and BTB domain-containing protein